ncbi:MAG: hypothetical protein WC273_06460 [Dehalococcoidia bacterium]
MALGAFYLGVAAWVYFARDIWMTDAVSRTGNAIYAVLSRDPHLGAIGFVWLPAPSVIQIPLVLILNLVHVPVFAGNVFSALAATAAVWVMWRLLADLRVPGGWVVALTTVYALNPMTVYYAVVGMSESFFILALLMVIWQFVVWVRDRSALSLAVGGVALAGAVWTRYEAIPLIVAVGIAYMLHELARDEDRAAGTRAQAVLMTLLGPAVGSLILWLFFNFLIMGDPLHFVNSEYGPMAQLRIGLRDGAGNTEVIAASKSLVAAAQFGLKRILLLSPFFVPIAIAVTARALFRKDWRAIGVLGIGGSMVLFSVYQLGTGGSFGWLRFFMYCQPLTIVFGAVAVVDYRRSVRNAVYAALLLAMLVAVPTSAWALWRADTGLEESGPVRHMIDPASPDALVEERMVTGQIAEYLDALPQGQLVYIQTVSSWGVAVQAKDRTRLVITNDSDAERFLDDPVKSLDYILVPPLGGISNNGEVIRRFPGIWENGEPWLRLEHEWKFASGPSYRLYRVIKDGAGG